MVKHTQIAKVASQTLAFTEAAKKMLFRKMALGPVVSDDIEDDDMVEEVERQALILIMELETLIKK